MAMAARFDIISARNPAIKELYKLRRKRKARTDEGVALIRGRRLIQEMSQLFPFRKVFTHEEPSKWGGYNAKEIMRVEKEALEHVLFGQRRDEYAKRYRDEDFVVGTVDHPEPVDDFSDDARWLLAVDGVKNPENMSLLLSSAVALNYDGVVLTGSCVDPFNYKVLEASQAVAWTFPYRYATAPELLALCKRHRLQSFAAHADGVLVADLPVSRGNIAGGGGTKGFCLAVGSESRGVQAELLNGCTKLALPMSELVESLNAGVAGGILMHGLACVRGR